MLKIRPAAVTEKTVRCWSNIIRQPYHLTLLFFLPFLYPFYSTSFLPSIHQTLIRFHLLLKLQFHPSSLSFFPPSFFSSMFLFLSCSFLISFPHCFLPYFLLSLFLSSILPSPLSFVVISSFLLCLPRCFLPSILSSFVPVFLLSVHQFWCQCLVASLCLST